MKYFSLLFVFLITQFSFADAWPEMTKAEAEAVVAELEKNPYIFDYCDCCDHGGEYAATVFISKVIKANIVACEMDENCYTIETESVILAEVFYGENGPDVTKLSKPGLSEVSQTIYMNYTWTLNPSTKKATPFFRVIPYNYYDFTKEACKQEFAYPTPAQLKKVSKDKGYKKWYGERVGK